MHANPDPTPPTGGLPLGRLERVVLAVVAALLALVLLWLRGGLHPAAPLERLARQSPELSAALADGRPTLLEFYADWCEACRAMAPSMEALERRHRGELDVVLLNVDNPRWQPELERFAVNGIPQLDLFDAGGQPVGRAIGARRGEELEALTGALLAGQSLPALAGVGSTSSLDGATAADAAPAAAAPGRSGGASAAIGPRSHG